MAESQQHGFIFEQRVLAAASNLRASSSTSQATPALGYTDRFDLPGHLDPTGAGIPTCVKVAKRSGNGRVRVDMADARRALELSKEPQVRLVVGVYDQVGGQKHVDEVHEYVVSGNDWSRVAGGLTSELVTQFHEDLAQGTPQQARALGRSRKAELAQAYPGGALQLSPKVDSKRQRRLQCSLYLDDLDKVLAPAAYSSSRVYKAEEGSTAAALWGMEIPLVIDSPPRIRNRKQPAVGEDPISVDADPTELG